MLRTLPQTRDWSLSRRLLAILAFTALTALCAQIRVQISEVPFTMQVFAVLLAAMVLGARDGAFSQILYLGLIAANLPIASNGIGASALQSVTAGYLVGFIPAGFVTGWLVEHGAQRTWQRWLAGLVGVAIIYACGVPVLKAATGMSWADAWAAGAGIFVLVDLAKSALAASLSEGSRALLERRAS